MSRSNRLRAKFYTPGQIQWILIAGSMMFWATSIALYLMALHSSFTITATTPWVYGNIHYLTSTISALIGSRPRLILDDFELYEPTNTADGVHISSPKARPATGNGKVTTLQTRYPQILRQQKTTKARIHTWFHVASHQWSSRPYRVMVHYFPRTIFLASYDYSVSVGRFMMLI